MTRAKKNDVIYLCDLQSNESKFFLELNPKQATGKLLQHEDFSTSEIEKSAGSWHVNITSLVTNIVTGFMNSAITMQQTSATIQRL